MLYNTQPNLDLKFKELQKEVNEKNKILDNFSKLKVVKCIDCNQPIIVSAKNNSPTPRCPDCKAEYIRKRRYEYRQKTKKEERIPEGVISYSGEELCEYGCGSKANFILKNGKYCCSTSPNKCETVRKKNSKNVIKAYSEGRKNNKNIFTKEKATEASNIRKQNLLKENIKEFRKDNPLTSNFLRYNMVNIFNKEFKCSCCGLSEWQGQPIPLEVHHKDGDHNNNEIENLEFLCLNCHALTDNFRGRNINSKESYVSDEEFIKALKETPSIRQALIKLNLSPRGGNYDRAYALLEKINKENV